MVKRTNSILVNFLMMTLSIILFFVVAETLTAVFSPQPVLIAGEPDIFFTRYDEETGWVNREGADDMYAPSPYIKNTRVRINSLGMRGGEVPREKAEGTHRILVLGDSVAFGYGLEEGEVFSAVLSRRLPPHYEVLNCGVFGYGTDQELLLFEREGLGLKPDIVILTFSAGDVANNMNSIDSGSGKPYFSMEGDRLVLKNTPVPRGKPYKRTAGPGAAIKSFVYRHSHLYRLILNRLAASNRFQRNSISEMTKEQGMGITYSIISRLDEDCRKNGSRLVLLLVSHEQLVAAGSRMPEGAEAGYFPSLKMQLASMGIPYVDTTPMLIDHYRRGEALFLKNDPVHLNERGNEIIGEAIYKKLEKQGWLVE